MRHGVTHEALSGLKPACSKEGTVTSANASGINDGAAAVIVMSAKKAEALGLTQLARIKAYANAGVDPKIMGMDPMPASKRFLKRAGWSVNDLNLMEINEALAAQALAVHKLQNSGREETVGAGPIAAGLLVG
ncbi:acetyl-CoA acetyltransferase [Caballeronia glebae]|uniref:Acetyl-CoA acetyltransferase n=1 Tax=Caballeronia glebae TaxID=1777143 RepID=A0A158A4E6_9BURK|nr:acetyl-CoA acetyltransferase [Caballeronia glebae]